MKLYRIHELREALDAECISYGELAEIEEAFAELNPATLRDHPENATASNMLDELERAWTVPARDIMRGAARGARDGAILALIAAGAWVAPSLATPCAEEDQTAYMCYWDGSARGDGRGASFIVTWSGHTLTAPDNN